MITERPVTLRLALAGFTAERFGLSAVFYLPRLYSGLPIFSLGLTQLKWFTASGSHAHSAGRIAVYGFAKRFSIFNCVSPNCQG